MEKEIRGVFAAVPTPFTINDEPDARLFLEHCEWVIDSGADGLNVLGSTGEATSQARKSRAALMRTASQSLQRRSTLMVGTGMPALEETIELTRLAAELGFDAALVLPPYYYAPLSEDGLFAYFSRVIESVKSTDIGIYLYNFPQMTGLSFSADFVERLLSAYPNHLRGMKDSSGDMSYTNQMAASFVGRFDVFPANESALPDTREFGYAGCISASVNATVKLAAQVWRQGDDTGADDVAALRELRKEISSVPIVSAVKTLVAMRTGLPEWQRMLPPLAALSGASREKMIGPAERLGLTHVSVGLS